MSLNTDFLGTGWSFPPQFNKDNGGVQLVSDETDILQSLQILMNTSAGERMMLPQYGCNMRDFLFQNIDNSFESYIKNVVSNAILLYEPRIDVNDLDLDTSDVAEGVITLEITYTVRTTNNRNNVVFPFYHTEGTLVNS
jgi:phage baseplate assembly protein W